MKKQTITLTLFLIINLLQAQNPLVKEWDKRFGGTLNDRLFGVKQTYDGGYLLGGASASGLGGDKTQNTWGQNDYWIVKIDSVGNKEWDKDFGGTDLEFLLSLQQTKDGGYILGGYSRSGINGDKTQNTWGNNDYWIVKVDSLGIKQWDKDFGGTADDRLFSVQQTTDNGFILGGWSNSPISGDKTQPPWGGFDYWIVKMDSLGNKLWDKRFGGTDDDQLYSLQQTSDGGYILGGWTSSGISGDITQTSWGAYDYWIVKIDSIGNMKWEKRFGGTGSEYLNSIQNSADGGFILAGHSSSNISGDKTQNTWGNFDYWMVKTDSLGNKQWDKDFGGINRDLCYSLEKTTDGGYILAGRSASGISGDKTENNLGAEQTWVIKIDSLGNKQWDKTLHVNSMPDDERGFAIETHDGCYSFFNYNDAGISGDKTQPSWGGHDYWIIKFCDTTLTTGINQINNSGFQVSIYPNPTNAILNLFVNNKENIIITNLLGEIVLQKNVEGKIELDVSFLSAGIYFIKVSNVVRKFVKE